MRPIERGDEIDSLLESAREEGLSAYLFVLTMLDAGLRRGEARALRWSRIVWGSDADDVRRHLVIDWNIPIDGEPGLPKSGRERRVALLRRLREALFELCRERGGSPTEEYVFPDLTDDRTLKRWVSSTWRRIVLRAGLAKVNPKDLRDTFASQLLTAGVQLGYVSAQLGHSNVAITAQHYARWVAGDEYCDPMVRAAGEVPADFLARLESHQSPTTDPTTLIDSADLLAGRLGFEPRLTGPEPVVLPLHHRPGESGV